MDEAEFLDRTRRVAEAFRPAAPIDRRELSAGRGRPCPAEHRRGLSRGSQRQARHDLSARPARVRSRRGGRVRLLRSNRRGEPLSRICASRARRPPSPGTSSGCRANRAAPSSRDTTVPERRATGSSTRSSSPMSPCADSRKASCAPATSVPGSRGACRGCAPDSRQIAAGADGHAAIPTLPTSLNSA